jgi:hypothetical protein
MTYSCSDFTDSILEALGVTVPDADADNPSAQADLALAAIASRPSLHWAIAYHSNSHSSRAKRWYRISRMVYADGGMFELYWHPDTSLRSGNLAEIRQRAAAQGLTLMPGIFRDKQGPRRGNEME